MASFTESARTADFIVSEGNGYISRESVIIASGEDLAAGAVVGKITASGKYAAYDNAAVDGTEAAAGVLYAAVDASLADKAGVIIARLAEVRKDDLVFDAGQDAAAKTAAYADLAALNIIVR